MRNITKIFIVVFSLILLFAVSCSNDDKTGINNPPENDTEITDGETGSGGTGSGSGSGDSSGTETGEETGGSSEGGSGSGSGSGSGEGGAGEVTPPSPSEPETPPSEPEIVTTEIEAKDFPEDLKGLYTHSTSGLNDISVRDDNGQTRILATLIPEDGIDGITPHTIRIKKWTKTTKGGKIIKIECKDSEGGYIITFDYENKTISGAYIINNKKYASFSGTKKP